MKHFLNVFFLATGFTFMIVSDLFGLSRYAVFGYTDEVFCAICLLILSINILRHKGIPKFYLYFIMLVLLGLLGNLFSGVQTDLKIIAVDTFIFCKPYILLLYMITTVKEHQIKKLYAYFTVISKALIIIICFFAVASLTFELNMLNAEGNFKFLSVSSFTGTVSMWTILFLAVIVSNKNNNRLLYYILSTVIVFMTDSGLGKLSIVGLLAIYIFLENMKIFKWYYLLIIIPICFWIGQNEIAGYLMNSDAPRFLLFYYSFVTAFKFFPLGSGFATYASAMANKTYSQLYYEYGFNHRYGMAADQRYYLMDSYYPQVIGQLGLIGAIVFGWFTILIFKKLIWKDSNRYIRNASIYLFATWAVAGLGFGISSSWGCAVYLLLSLLYLLDKLYYQNSNLEHNENKYFIPDENIQRK